MPELYLPELRKGQDDQPGHAVPTPHNPAEWSRNESKILGLVSDGIAVSAGSAAKGVSSIPDVWARPMLFQTMLAANGAAPDAAAPVTVGAAAAGPAQGDQDGLAALRAGLLSEWRGLMSLLALRTVKGLDVSVVPITLDDGRFSEALRRLKPDAVPLEVGNAPYAWDQILMIRYGGFPVGALSPTTLVYTATEYAPALLRAGLPMTDENGKLCPPTDADSREALTKWVLGLKDTISAITANNGYTNAIARLLNAWLAELTGGQQESQVAAKAWDVAVASAPAGLTREWAPPAPHRVYDALLRPLLPIPAVWRRPLDFERTLANQNHASHLQAVQEWRGLMAVLALRVPLGLRVDFDARTVTEQEVGPALFALKPPDAQIGGETYSWADVVDILYNKQRIGQLSLATLVAPTTDHADVLRDNDRRALWDSDGHLHPPAEESNRRYLYEWVDDQLNDLTPLIELDTLPVRLLRDWHTELAQEFGSDPNNDDAERATFQSQYGPEPWEHSGAVHLFETLLRPLVEADGGGSLDGKSDLYLASDPARRSMRRGARGERVLVITEALLRDNPRLWGMKTARLYGTPREALDTTFNKASDSKVADTALPDGVRWIRPERYFLTDTLVGPKGGGFAIASDPLPEKDRNQEFRLRASNGEGRLQGKYLLPFTKELLDHFSPAYIRQHLKPTFEEAGSGAVRFTFNLLIGSWDDPGLRTVRVERVYRQRGAAAGEGTLREEHLPTLVVFPRHFPGWGRYTVLLGDADRFDVMPVPAGEVLRPIEHTSREAFFPDPADPTRQVRRQAKLITLRGMNGDPFPEGVALFAGNEPVGLILAEPTEQATGRSNTLQVGVDFGTSNTNVYFQGKGASEPWRLDLSRLLLPLTEVPAADRGALLETFLVPNEVIQFPIPTFLNRHVEPPIEDRMFLDHHVRFQLPGQYSWGREARASFKWNDPELNGKLFFRSLLMLIMLEAYKREALNVDLRLSFPKSFSDGQKQRFRNDWLAACKMLSQEPGALLNVAGQRGSLTISLANQELISVETEGEASGRFFKESSNIKDADDKATLISLCLDVGGGSTDISLWLDGKIKADASLRLAGEPIADFLRQQHRLRTLLLSDDADRAIHAAGRDDALFAARLNLILRSEGDDIGRRLNDHGDDESVTKLRRFIAFEFGALAFYAATLIVASERNGTTPKLLDDIAIRGVKLLWGGNAARLINWIDFSSRYDHHGTGPQLLNHMVEGVLDKAEASSISLRQVQSPFYKQEAAEGLVLGRPSNGAAAARANSFVTGETLVLGPDDHRLEYYESVTEAALYPADGQTSVRDVQCDRLSLFVELFNGFCDTNRLPEFRVSFDDALRRAVETEVLTSISGEQNKDSGHRSLEPAFILGVKQVLNRL